MRRSILLSVLVLAVAALVVSLVRPGVVSASANTNNFATSMVVRACPHTDAGVGRTSMVGIATVPSSAVPTAQPATGTPSATLRAIARTVPLATLTRPAQQSTKSTGAGGLPGTLSVGTGTLAGGLAASEWSMQVTGRSRGLMSTDCLTPRADYWFVGGGSGVGRSTSLIVSNPDATTAQATVSLIGDNGPITVPSLAGLQLAGHAERTISLTALAPGASHLVVHVRVDSGHMGAWVTDHQSLGQLGVGSEYVPPAASPSRTAVLPGVSDGVSSRELLLYVPGTLGAQVTVHVLSTTHSFIPSGMSAMTVAPGRAVHVTMSTVAMPIGSALEISSDQPLLASEHSALPRTGTVPTDSVYAAAASPIDQAATTTTLLDSGIWSSRLVLAAPSALAHVKVLIWSTPTNVQTMTFNVPAGFTRAVLIPDVGKAYAVSVAVIPEPDSGPVYGSVGQGASALSSGPLGSVRPLVSTPLTVEIPPVQSDPRTALNTTTP